jgi:hypothetical protein
MALLTQIGCDPRLRSDAVSLEDFAVRWRADGGLLAHSA